MKSKKCGHPKCRVKHKSETGYCYKHASDIDKHEAKPRRVMAEPLLYEEALDRATTLPKVI